MITPNEFIDKWKAAELKERSAAQEHFIDLCRLLGEPTPAEADPKGEWFCFERGASKAAGGEGWADVWKRGHFGWEYKGRRKDLNAALGQLQQYALALENPPLLVVCDLDRFRIHTNWTNTVSQVHEIALEDLRDAAVRQKLKWVLSEPARLRPGKTRQALTEEAAAEFARLAQRLREQGHEPATVAHFINRLVFCMFAEDVNLLPNRMFTRMLEHTRREPGEFQSLASDLFRAMKDGGRIGFERVAWFNGGLFDDDMALPLAKPDIELVLRAAALDWAEIDPSIFGTLFERGLDPDKRSQLGAHYTDHDKIMLLVEPVIVRPWLRDWAETKEAMSAALAKADSAKAPSTRTKAVNDAERLYRAFLDRLRAFRVLDPACGSGNFLNLALLALKDLEHRASIEAEAMGLHREFPQVGPDSVLGIEINPYAAELARVSVWIGEIRWMLRNGFAAATNPILKPLQTIECRDALLNEDGSEAAWPKADVVIGNPPFLGDKLMLSYLGTDYVQALRHAYKDRVPGGADLVCYWFAKSSRMLQGGKTRRAGLVATNSIRGGANRVVLDRLSDNQIIFEAWQDQGWTVEGASVRVSLVCIASGSEHDLESRLNGKLSGQIFADLTAGEADLTLARPLRESKGVSFIGSMKKAPFDIPGDLARVWLREPTNPNGRRNSDVLLPWANGKDVTYRPSGRWIIDFDGQSDQEAQLYPSPYKHVRQSVFPHRQESGSASERRRWWLLARRASDMVEAVSRLPRFLATPRNGRHRIFVWLRWPVLPDGQLVLIARDDDTTFGILHSRFHQNWSLRLCTWLGVGNDPRYTPSTTFATFTFPEGLTPNIPAVEFADDPRAIRIATAAARLNEFREAWLNPPDLVYRVPEWFPAIPTGSCPRTMPQPRSSRPAP